MIKKIKNFWSTNKKEISYILILFLITRIVLTVIGFIGEPVMGDYLKRPIYSEIKALNVWSFWDTGWYLNIVKNGYTTKIGAFGQANYGFFPMYPIMVKIFSFIFVNRFISALIAANVFFILAAFVLYKLAKIDFDEKSSFRTVKYLFFYPGAFILSGAMSESLFLLLSLLCFYFARKQKWLYAGLSGIFLSATKPFGFIIILALLYEYLKLQKPDFKKEALKIIKNVFFILIIPLGLFLFALHTYFLTGDLLAYPHVKQHWNNYLASPVSIAYWSFIRSPFFALQITSAIIMVLALIFFRKKIRYSYYIYGILIAIFGLSFTGVSASMIRYYSGVFPIYLIMGKASENEKIDTYLTAALLLLQGFLVLYWKV